MELLVVLGIVGIVASLANLVHFGTGQSAS